MCSLEAHFLYNLLSGNFNFSSTLFPISVSIFDELSAVEVQLIFGHIPYFVQLIFWHIPYFLGPRQLVRWKSKYLLRRLDAKKLLIIPKNNAANVTDIESIRMSVSIAFGSGSLKKLNFHLPWYDRKRQLEKETFWCHWKNFK